MQGETRVFEWIAYSRREYDPLVYVYIGMDGEITVGTWYLVCTVTDCQAR